MDKGIVFKDKQYEKTFTANINRLATQLDRYLDRLTSWHAIDLSDAEAESIPGVAKLLYELYQWGAEVSHDSQN